jgi:secondary thiamine-phosphate synthase enzyme
MIQILSFKTRGQGLYEITNDVTSVLYTHTSQNDEGLLTLFIQHTSASLTIQENADPSAKHDLEHWMKKFVQFDKEFTHTLEGKDDMPSHIKAALTQTSISIPFQHGRVLLGTWQGIYLWEHRDTPHTRKVVISF